jgi:hypothetical protein
LGEDEQASVTASEHASGTPGGGQQPQRRVYGVDVAGDKCALAWWSTAARTLSSFLGHGKPLAVWWWSMAVTRRPWVAGAARQSVRNFNCFEGRIGNTGIWRGQDMQLPGGRHTSDS